ncbi:MAG: hypothetical protein AAGJ37_15295 [Pseudomonadota bacterium]
MAMIKKGLLIFVFFCVSSMSALANQTEQENIDIDALIAGGASSVLCEMGERSRIIVLDSPSSTSEFMCRVVYSTEYGISVPWYAKWDENFCVEKARELVNRQVSLGFECNRQN